MADCVFRIDETGQVLKGYSEFKAFLASGGLEQLYPDGSYPWLPKVNNETLPPEKAMQLKEAHKAFGRDVKKSSIENQIAILKKEISTGKTNNGGVLVNLRPKAINQRKEQLSRLKDDLALFDSSSELRGDNYVKEKDAENNLPNSRAATAANAGRGDSAVQPTRVVNEKTSTVKIGVTEVNSPEDALHIVESFSNRAGEQMLAIVLDDNKKVLQVIRHTSGLIDSSMVDVGVLAGSIHDVPKARYVYFAHNHPSGITDQSQSDYNITDKLEGFLRNTGIESKGMLVIGQNGEGSFYDENSRGRKSHEITATKAERTKSIPVTERIIERHGRAMDDSVTSQRQAVDIAKEMSGGKSGIILLDNQHYPVSFVPMTLADMARLRSNKGSGSSLLSKEIHKSNARAMLAYAPSKSEVAGQVSLFDDGVISEIKPSDDIVVEAAKNLSRFANNSGNTRLLDFVVGKNTLQSSYVDYSVQNSEVYFSRAADKDDIDNQYFADTRFSFAGQNAKTADKYQLANAQSRLENGEDAETVRKETGWFKDEINATWKFEIDDSNAKLKGSNNGGLEITDLLPDGDNSYGIIPLHRALKHDALFAAYPHLMDVKVKFDSSLKGSSASYSSDGLISLSPDLRPGSDNESILPVLLHEIQHAIQEQEGFARGGNSKSIREVLTDVVNDKRGYADYAKQQIEMVSVLQRAATNLEIVERLKSNPTSIKKMQEWFTYKPFAIPVSKNERKNTIIEVANKTINELRYNNDVNDALEYVGDKNASPKDLRNAARQIIKELPKGNIDEIAIVEKLESALNKYNDIELYTRLAGEIEARNTQARAGLTEAERKATPPSATQDIPDSDAIVVWNGQEMHSVPANAAQTVAPTYTKNGLIEAIRTSLDSIFGNGWTERLLATGKFKVVSSDEAKAVAGDDTLFSIYNHMPTTRQAVFEEINIVIQKMRDVSEKEKDILARYDLKERIQFTTGSFGNGGYRFSRVNGEEFEILFTRDNKEQVLYDFLRKTLNESDYADYINALEEYSQYEKLIAELYDWEHILRYSSEIWGGDVFSPVPRDAVDAKNAVATRIRNEYTNNLTELLNEQENKQQSASSKTLLAAWKNIADSDNAFAYGKSSSSNIKDIANELTHGFVMVMDYGDMIKLTGKNGSVTINRADTKRPYISASGAGSNKEKQGGGTAMYQVAFTWAHNNNKTMVGDPAGLTDVNVLRRTENMVSSALRHGTTRHLSPSDKQKHQGLLWKGNDERKIASMLQFSSHLVFNAVPFLTDVLYNPVTDKFTLNGIELSDEEIEEKINESGASRQVGIGISTAKRAIITSSILQNIQERKLDFILQNNDGGIGRQPILYSKAGKIHAFYNPKDKTTYFVHDNIDKDTNLYGLMLHEIGVHALRLGHDVEEFNSILGKFEALRNNPKVKVAFARVPESTKPAHVTEEALAYFLEHNPDHTLTQRFMVWLKKAIRAISKTLGLSDRLKFNQWANSLNEADLRDMAISALRGAPESLLDESNLADGDSVLIRASKAGYEGNDKGEAEEWLRAKAKGLDMSKEARMARAKAMGFDVDKVWYHGRVTNDIVNNVIPLARRGSSVGAYYLTNSKKVATAYAKTSTPKNNKKNIEDAKLIDGYSPNVTEIITNIRNPITDNTTIFDLFDTDELISALSTDNSELDYAEFWDEEEKQDAIENVLDNTGPEYTSASMNDNLSKIFGFLEQYPSFYDELKENYDGVIYSDNEAGGITSVPFKDNSIRSINAAFDPDYADSPNLLASAPVDRFYSALRRAFLAAPDKVFQGNSGQVKLWINNNLSKFDVKKDEVYWSGLNDWLDTKTKVSRDDVVRFVSDNGVKVEDVVLGDATSKYEKARLAFNEHLDNLRQQGLTREDIAKDSEYHRLMKLRDLADEAQQEVLEPKHNTEQLTLPNGKDYRELVITVPSVDPWNAEDSTHFGSVGKPSQQDIESFKKQKNNINQSVDDDFLGIIDRMKHAGVLEVDCG